MATRNRTPTPRTEERKQTTANAAILATFTRAPHLRVAATSPVSRRHQRHHSIRADVCQDSLGALRSLHSLLKSPRSTADVKRPCSARQAPRRFRLPVGESNIHALVHNCRLDLSLDILVGRIFAEAENHTSWSNTSSAHCRNSSKSANVSVLVDSKT